MPILLDVMLTVQMLLLVAALGLSLWLVMLTMPGLVDGPPFVGLRRDRQQRLLELADLKPGETVIDLGSGDGRLLLAAAERGCRVVGYEINAILVLRSLQRLWLGGHGRHSKVRCGDFWRADLSQADVVLLYGFPAIMGRMEKKLEAELKPGARVAVACFPLPNWTATATAPEAFLYVKKG